MSNNGTLKSIMFCISDHSLTHILPPVLITAIMLVLLQSGVPCRIRNDICVMVSDRHYVYKGVSTKYSKGFNCILVNISCKGCAVFGCIMNTHQHTLT